MCGFFAVISKTKINENEFSSSLNTIKYRGPDSQKKKFYEIDNIYFGLGFNRLSIIDPFERSDQPYSSNDKKILMFNGEIYNYLDLSKESNWQRETNSDTEVLYNLLCEKKTEAFQKLNGMWAITFFDFIKKDILLSRDRFGQKPLYYFLDDKKFIISSSPQSINYYLKNSLEFSDDAVNEYLNLGFNFTNKSIFKNIKTVANSSYEIFNFSKWKFEKKSKFFDYNNICYDQKLSNNLKLDLLSAVDRTLISDRPIGLLLSGGIDSQIILQLSKFLKKQTNLNFYCMYNDESDFDFINTKIIDDHLKLNVNYIKDTGHITLKKFKQICKHQHNLFPLIGNVISTNQIYEHISQTETKVVLDGCGADEIFAGYDYRYFSPFIKELFKNKKYFKIYNEVKFLNKNYLSFYFKDFIKYTFPFLKKLNKKNKYLKDTFYRNTDPIFGDNLDFNQLLKVDSFDGRLGMYLAHLDENSMMYGLENRSPFLDKEIIKYINSNYENKVINGSYKSELKKILKSFDLPKNFKLNKKKGLTTISLNNFFNENKDHLLDYIMNSKIINNISKIDLIYNDCKKGKINPTIFSRLSVTALMEQC